MSFLSLWMSRIVSVAILAGFSASASMAQQGGAPKTGSTQPPGNSTGANKSTTTKTRPVLPAYHPPAAHHSTTLAPTTASGLVRPNPVAVQPSINSSLGYQSLLNTEMAQYSVLWSLNHPYLFNPFVSLINPFVPMNNPYLPLMSLYNPFTNPFVGLNNPFVGLNNPFVGLNNPFVGLNNPFVGINNPFVGFNNPFLNPFAVNGFAHPPFLPLGNGFGFTPPAAIQQPGQLISEGPNLAVNPISGTVVHPISGFATMADGSTFYRLGAGTYYNPVGGTFFNPSTGFVIRPAQVNPIVP